ncbi:hypothetical protein MSG28_003844 [Choristoneura fumiferana]|uniref:Uncharacterized protein n=1 Tax=Choristoneura fumiferana TaxID=7141 RepID=A0ACC0KG87_CHOFU|nr:hypothetical protein MSG28_003844 [Choristoneura fumiferana]
MRTVRRLNAGLFGDYTQYSGILKLNEIQQKKEELLVLDFFDGDNWGWGWTPVDTVATNMDDEIEEDSRPPSTRRNFSLRNNAARQVAINFMPSRHLPGNTIRIRRSASGRDALLEEAAAEAGAPECAERRADHIVREMEQHQRLMEDNPEAEEMRREALRDLPQGLTMKRHVRAKLSASVSLRSKSRPLSCYKRLKYRMGFAWKRMRDRFRDFVFSVELWYEPIRAIEGHFGSAVGSFFYFLRWLFVLDLLLAGTLVAFVVVPQALHDEARNDTVRWGFLDFVSGKTLGEPVEHWDTLLIHLVTQKLDSKTFHPQVHASSHGGGERTTELVHQKSTTAGAGADPGAPVTLSANRIEQLRQHFWTRWSKEYVSELQQRTKWRSSGHSLKLNSLVLLKEDNLPPLKWKLGRIISVHPGPDGVNRVADVKTANGVVRRAFSRICPLPEEKDHRRQSSIYQQDQKYAGSIVNYDPTLAARGRRARGVSGPAAVVRYVPRSWLSMGPKPTPISSEYMTVLTVGSVPEFAIATGGVLRAAGGGLAVGSGRAGGGLLAGGGAPTAGGECAGGGRVAGGGERCSGAGLASGGGRSGGAGLTGGAGLEGGGAAPAARGSQATGAARAMQGWQAAGAALGARGWRATGTATPALGAR